MECNAVREHLLAWQRGRVDPTVRRDLEAHLQGCASCRKAERVEAELSRLLTDQLPRHRASAELRARVAAGLAGPGRAAPAVVGRRRTALASLAAAAASAAAVLLVVRWTQPAFLQGTGGRVDLVDEAVNDHLRVVASSRPLEIESGGIHQVKPWFAGRLDFAPRVAFDGDAEFALKGGSVGYVGDRKAAVFVFGFRLHTLTLLVFPAEGLAWPAGGYAKRGPIEVRTSVVRGFTVLLWRAGELGYCLVSDMNAGDMERLAVKIAGP
jgi:anti-sigma factor RsiW